MPDRLAAPVEAKLGNLAALLEGLAASRQARVGHEIIVQVEFVAVGRLQPGVTAVRIKPPALFIIDQVGDHDLVEQLGVDRRIVDRKHIFDPPTM